VRVATEVVVTATLLESRVVEMMGAGVPEIAVLDSSVLDDSAVVLSAVDEDATEDVDSTVLVDDGIVVDASVLVLETTVETAEEEEEDARALQIAAVTWRVVAASEAEHAPKTQGVAAVVMADWLGASHWHALSEAAQLVAEATAFRIQL